MVTRDKGGGINWKIGINTYTWLYIEFSSVQFNSVAQWQWEGADRGIIKVQGIRGPKNSKDRSSETIRGRC